jgi:ribosomal protein S18 acetylase RimI-like enzyme
MISVSAVDEVTEDLVKAVHRLLPQLSGSARLPSADEVAEIVASPATTLLVATRDEPGPEVVGMLTLAVFRIPTGTRAWVEDVVVDAGGRRQGVGEALLRAAVGTAAAQGAQTLDLTSRPSREAANRLYLRAGFELRQTNVYRFKLSS